eukprot:12492112-Alexandrium_andersonii.AAC.1
MREALVGGVRGGGSPPPAREAPQETPGNCGGNCRTLLPAVSCSLLRRCTCGVALEALAEG